MKDSSYKGFSLLEIVVVLLIMTLIVSWAIPAWQSIVQNWQNRRAIQLAYRGLQRARLEAVQNHKRCFFCLTKGHNHCVRHQASGYVVMCQESQQSWHVEDVGRFPHPMLWHWQGLASHHLGFNMWGGSTANGRLSLAGSRNQGVKTILISHTGRVRLSS